MVADENARRRVRAHHLRMVATLATSLVLGGCGVLRDRIEPESPPLARVEADVKRALIEASGIDAAALLVSATGESVTLEGFVADEAERAVMLRAARAAAPGRDIIDAMTVHR